MKKALLCLASLAIGISLSSLIPSVAARDQFKKAFDAKYVKEDPQTPEEKQFAEAVKKANCNICHEGTDRKKRNDYGKEYGKHVTTKDVPNKAKHAEGLELIEGAKSPTGESFGDRIKKGKLPIDFVPPGPAAAGG